MGRPSSNGAGPENDRTRANALVSADEINHPANRNNDYRWKNLRTYKSMKDVKTTPINNEVLAEARCHRRTCRKKFTPKRNNQYLCNSCIEEQKKKQRKANVEAKLRSLHSR